jgi:hypothetical protein
MDEWLMSILQYVSPDVVTISVIVYLFATFVVKTYPKWKPRIIMLELGFAFLLASFLVMGTGAYYNEGRNWYLVFFGVVERAFFSVALAHFYYDFKFKRDEKQKVINEIEIEKDDENVKDKGEK